MTNFELYDKVCTRTSRDTTQQYSTSFSLGIRALNKNIREAIYGIYGFVRFADEIVDTFHDHDQERLLAEFREQTYEAIDRGISLNPILQSFQRTVNYYSIDRSLIDTFLRSMQMDLHQSVHDQASYEEYILGSAEVVGLMCLKVFCNGEEKTYDALKPSAMSLGAAFQKVNFLRDLRADHKDLGRTYFPGIEMSEFDTDTKSLIEEDIEKDFRHAFEGIQKLPKASRFGVYLAYIYYRKLFQKIKRAAPERIMHERIRVPNNRKIGLFVNSYVRHSFNML